MVRRVSSCAIVRPIFDFSDVQHVIYYEQLHLLNIMLHIEVFNGDTLDFTKKMGEIGVVVTWFFTEVI